MRSLAFAQSVPVRTPAPPGTTKMILAARVGAMRSDRNRSRSSVFNISLRSCHKPDMIGFLLRKLAAISDLQIGQTRLVSPMLAEKFPELHCIFYFLRYIIIIIGT